MVWFDTNGSHRRAYWSSNAVTRFQVEATITTWLVQFGAPALFVLLMLGVFGVPIPDETVLVLAGLLVSRGRLPPLATLVAAILGAMTGITVSYTAGRLAGLPLLRRYGTRFHVQPVIIERVERWFARFGKWLLTAGYFIPGVRHLTAIVAGAAGLSPWTFSVFAYSGAALWAGSFLLIGAVLGEEWPVFVAALHRRLVAGYAVVLTVLLYVAWRWTRQRRERGTSK
ncbi:MAG: DedA family protein [Acidobacteria bacterium]|nr:MAG: DedA family protein [Acidobacteriota bacterium]